MSEQEFDLNTGIDGLRVLIYLLIAQTVLENETGPVLPSFGGFEIN